MSLHAPWLHEFSVRKGQNYRRTKKVEHVSYFQFGKDEIIAKKKSSCFCVADGMSLGASLGCSVRRGSRWYVTRGISVA